MPKDEISENTYMKRTSAAYIWTRVLDTPFWGLFNLLPFILYKDLHASPFQLAMIITLKPLVSIFSTYWSRRAFGMPSRLSSSIIQGRWIAFFPFLAFPFIHNPWYVIACFGLFMLLQVGMMPAWMELLKQNVPARTRENVFSYTQAFGYLGGGLMPFALGWILDEWVGAWRWMFVVTAVISLCAFFWQRTILIRPSQAALQPPNQTHVLLQPWKSALDILRQRPDFARFQIGFMLIGSGLMIVQPALPVFFVEDLHLSYMELGIAITLCKGIAFACGSPLWVRLIQRIDLFRLGAIIALLAGMFPLFLLAAENHIIWLYLGYLTYGLMQSGNELSWNMSGPLFAKQEDSSPYSSVNVIAVGVRGIFVPLLGALSLSLLGSSTVIVFSSVLCMMAALRMALYSRQVQSQFVVHNS
jgi:MFS family permease